MPPVNCVRRVMRGDLIEVCTTPRPENAPSDFEIMAREASDALNRLSEGISRWWHGGDTENNGTQWGRFWCRLSGSSFEGWNYDFVTGGCEVFGDFVNQYYTENINERPIYNYNNERAICLN